MFAFAHKQAWLHSALQHLEGWMKQEIANGNLIDQALHFLKQRECAQDATVAAKIQIRPLMINLIIHMYITDVSP